MGVLAFVVEVNDGQSEAQVQCQQHCGTPDSWGWKRHLPLKQVEELFWPTQGAVACYASEFVNKLWMFVYIDD